MPMLRVTQINLQHSKTVSAAVLLHLTVNEKQPWRMPTVDGVLSTLAGKKYFSTLHTMFGYYQIEIDEESKKYTVFITHHGHFEFNRMKMTSGGRLCSIPRASIKSIPLDVEVDGV